MGSFFKRPILNSPCPDRHWELDGDGHPTNKIVPTRWKSMLLNPCRSHIKASAGLAGASTIYNYRCGRYA
jgi:type III restriction enzyme